MLNRLRGHTTGVMAEAQKQQLSRFLPFFLLIILAAYLLMGSACFWLFEHDAHEASVQSWYRNLAANRRQFAKSISSRIFNDTRNLLIIIDREQTDRVQQLLVESLRRYEDRTDVKAPDRKEWTFWNSFNYAYGLLLTLGHGAKVPETTCGQVFAVAYVLMGIPLFFGSLAVCCYRSVLPALEGTQCTFNRRLLVFQLFVALYILWSLLLALILYYLVFDDFWKSVFTAFISGMTVQVPSYGSLSELNMTILLLSCTVSAALLIESVILFCSLHCSLTKSVPTKKPIEQATTSSTAQNTPKFTVVVDEAGESKLVDH